MLEMLHGALLLEAQNNVSKAVQLILSINPIHVPLSRSQVNKSPS